MKPNFTYHPLIFYLITTLFSLACIPLVAYFSNRGQNDKVTLLLCATLFLPCLTAIALTYFSGNKEMIHDLWSRLILFKIPPMYLMIILLFMPCLTLLATLISLAFGYSSEQFLLAKTFSVMKGWSLLGIVIPLAFAPLIEELGWRGYGVDSLRFPLQPFSDLSPIRNLVGSLALTSFLCQRVLPKPAFAVRPYLCFEFLLKHFCHSFHHELDLLSNRAKYSGSYFIPFND